MTVTKSVLIISSRIYDCPVS